MKKGILFVAFTMLLSSCGGLKGLSAPQSTSEATQAAGTAAGNVAAAAISSATSSSNVSGQNAGIALKNLYAQYKADGKYDTSNLQNIINTLTLIDNCKSLKENGKDSDYWKSFAGGLILGSENLVTESIAGTVTNNLGKLVESVDTNKVSETASKVSNATTKAAETASTVAAAANSVCSILSLFGK